MQDSIRKGTRGADQWIRATQCTNLNNRTLDSSMPTQSFIRELFWACLTYIRIRFMVCIDLPITNADNPINQTVPHAQRTYTYYIYLSNWIMLV